MLSRPTKSGMKRRWILLSTVAGVLGAAYLWGDTIISMILVILWMWGIIPCVEVYQ